MGDLIRALVERLVDRRAELPAGDEVDDGRREDDGERDRDGRGESDAGAEAHARAHGSRSAYPTPRTVWIRRVPPPASVLRRRYPM